MYAHLTSPLIYWTAKKLLALPLLTLLGEKQSRPNASRVNSHTDARSLPALFFFFANEVRISTKRRYPTLRKGTLLLSKYMQEAFALIQDIVPSHCQPGFLFHTSSTMSRPHRFCTVLEDCIATEEEKGNNGSNTSEFEGISNPSSRGGQPNCPWNENIFLHIWSCH